ncbi:AzlD domain-containing protein [Lacticaseibacillus nasuensis]|uniref:AzlD domain-containing protein n=1 Tax=Lacticaseibacillus nasuensis TaxID=944671 RepID=UPI00224767F3|nr:AzlD domain-containing protein [Lacticaseibacillus nasuensis]MCX2456252.1 AzlD domain-containing protein [Lacticaseibacillus nasuensis]
MPSKIMLTILGAGVGTWLIRVVPFLLVKAARLPKWVLQFLSFVPVAILTAIFVEGMLVYRPGQWPTVNPQNLIAAVPTVVAAIISKSLLVTVVVSVVSMAAVRALGWG